MRTKLICLLLLALLSAMSVAVQGAVFSDDFTTPHDFVADGIEGTNWDGFLGLGDGETVDALNVSMDREGQLFIQSTNAFWHEPWEPIGPFLYTVVEGDFIATVKVTEYEGTESAPVYYNNCGLLARAFPDEAGVGEDWVALDYFPLYSCGNFVRSADENVRTENGHNGKAFGLDPYLQIERIGNTFHFRSSTDGVTWTELGVSPLTRDDFDGIPLQVGLYQGTYSSTQGYSAFDEFTVEGPLVVPGFVAYGPTPADGAVDVPRDAALAWRSADLSATFDVYFGTDLASVMAADRANPMGVLVSQGQSQMSYDPTGLFEYEQTYYWRIDMIAGADGAIYPSDIWSFTAEPFAYAIEGIDVTSSAIAQEGTVLDNIVDGSGLNENDEHSVNVDDMWIAGPDGDQPVWLQFEFDEVYKLYEMAVWNYNALFEDFLGFGLKDVTIEISEDGDVWTTLGDYEFARAPSLRSYTANTRVDMQGVPARYVRFNVNSTWGNNGKYGLSEVRFTYVPVRARDPRPSDGAANVALDPVLSWRAGREAASHEVYFSADRAAVEDGTAVVATVNQTAYSRGDLDLATTYYWKVNEVNAAESISAWEGAIWTFSTLESIMIEDFESYTDDIEAGGTIWQTWVDGLDDPTNGGGAVVGYDQSPFAEQDTVHGGAQAMPLFYNNTESPYFSQATRTWETPQNWQANGAEKLTLYFRGHPAGLLERPDGTLTIGGIGVDIWGTVDEFQYVHKQLSGNGSIVARVDSLINSDGWAKAGVMIRESLDPGARNAFVCVTPGNGVSFQYRTALSGDSASITTAGLTVPYWVKLTRSGNTFTAQRSEDGVTWVSITDDPAASTVELQMISNVYIGLAVTSHNAMLATNADFSNVQAGGTGQWQADAIGVDQPSNDPEPLYVVVTDTAGHSATVVHEDPEATLATTWQTWDMPLSDLTSAGVNASAVKSMRIGLGDRANPSMGGSGVVYVDDIQYGSEPKAPVTTYESSEDFSVAHDYLADGVDGTFWDGFLGLGQGETADAINASIDRQGQLYIASTGGFYHEPWDPIGPFLYKVVEGDFIATVKVAEYAGTPDVWVFYNTCGLMARAMPEDAGVGEDWVSLDYFPLYSCGNFVRTADENVRTEVGHNGKAFNLDPYLQIERDGNTMHFRTSADGVSWTEMAVSPIVRDDFDGVPLQVGLFQATYSGEQGYAAFDDFALETP